MSFFFLLDNFTACVNVCFPHLSVSVYSILVYAYVVHFSDLLLHFYRIHNLAIYGLMLSIYD